MEEASKRLMKPSEIPSFIADIIDAGCDICAISRNGYVIGDADLSEDEYETARPKLERINEKYGDRDLLRREIAAYLHSIGRYFDDDFQRQDRRRRSSQNSVKGQ